MLSESLTIAVLFADGKVRPEILEILESFPQLNLIGQTCDPDDLLDLLTEPPDLIFLGMSGEGDVPEWLKKLPQRLPQTALLACSDNWQPDFLIRAMQVGVRDFLTLPINRSDLKAAIERAYPSNKLGHIIAVTGNKGGVGITTVAINLAVALGGLTTDQVALVDLGRPFPDIAKFLDLKPTYSLSDLIHSKEALDKDFLKKIMQPYSRKIEILHGATDLHDQSELGIELIEKVFVELRQMYKYIVVDLSNWIDNLFVKVMQEAELVILLTGLTITDINNMQQLWSLLIGWGQPINRVKVVVNRINKGTKIQMDSLKEITNSSPFETLPSGYLFLMDALNEGKPLGMVAPRSNLWDKIKNMAELVQKQVESIHREDRDNVEAAPSKRRFWVF